MAAAFTNPDSKITKSLMQLSHSFGYDCKRRGNLHLLDQDTLAFVAGNVMVLLDMNTKQQHYIASCSGGGVGAIMPHPNRECFAVAEKGKEPDIIIYEYPSLQPYRTLRGGTWKAYSCINFNQDGTLLASIGGDPDYMLTLWNWNQEQVVLRYKAFSQDVYRVTFSPYLQDQLTTSGSGHIKFWTMADTFTCLKLQGILGKFGKYPLSDIEGYIELPDGKVVSGSEWGNMLLWDGGLIKVEIGRKGGRTCHAGCLQQFALDEGELITVGADGAIRSWDFDAIDTADCAEDSGRFEMEPMNELTVGRHVSLSCMVKSTIPQSTFWFAQDSNGRIWKLDLFSNKTKDPECLFSFHAGAIEGMDVSGFSHLMATTASDRSVRIFDFLSNKELTVGHYSQGGSTLTWTPHSVYGSERFLLVGFQDGVVRVLEFCQSQSLYEVHKDNLTELHLKQAFKPHNAPVTAISFKDSGEILATGSSDGTVFFFSVRESYEPIGFVTVPGPVQGLQWAPPSHERNAILVICEMGHVVEIEAPNTRGPISVDTYLLHNLPTRHFRFHSIASHIKREAEISRRQAMKKMRQKEEEEDQEESSEDEEELPPIFIPDTPSPIHCAFYSTETGAFWLSMGGYDSGYLYHCKFSKQQIEEVSERRDKPFAYVPVKDTEHNPILTVCFCKAKKLLLCGMQDGSIRVYPLQSEDLQPMNMQTYRTFGVHDGQYGSPRHLRVSHDSRFVLSSGADGNIFSFRLLDSMEVKEDMEDMLQPGQARVPSPHLRLDTEPAPVDIEDPDAYSIETAKQKMESDHMHREAELCKREQRIKLTELKRRFEALLKENQSLPEHVRLQASELELDCSFRDEIERQTAERVRQVERESAWEKEKYRIGLQKFQERFTDSLDCDNVTVSAIRTDHNVSTYRLVALSRKLEGSDAQHSDLTPQESSDTEEEKETDAEVMISQSTEIEEALPSDLTDLQLKLSHGAGGKLVAREAEKLRRAAEKSEKARAKIEQRKREWKELYAAKPSKDYADPEDIHEIQQAKENMGDFKLKMAKDFTVPEHLRMNVEKKMAQIMELEEQIYQKKSEMNMRVLALRDSKAALVSQFRSDIRQLLDVQKLLPPEKHRPPPTIPTLTPEETPERAMKYNRTTLERYAAARAKMNHKPSDEHEETPNILDMMQQDSDEDTHTEEVNSDTKEVNTESMQNLSGLELEIIKIEEIRNLYQQDKLLKQMEEAVCIFDANLHLLRHEKSELDIQLNLAELQHITLLQELLIFKDFEKTESPLQEQRNTYRLEERELRLKLEDWKHQLEVKNREIEVLHQREKALSSTFQASLGEGNKFAKFLLKVFMKKSKRVKKEEKPVNDVEEEEVSEEDTDEDTDWLTDDDDEEWDEGAWDYRVCPPDCDPELFKNTVMLREHRLDLEELFHEMKVTADSLRKDCDSLTKKVEILQSHLKTVEGDMQLLNQEKQQKVNGLDVVVPLLLHQIEYMDNGLLPSDLSGALLINKALVSRLEERIKELQQEKNAQRELFKQAHQQKAHLRRELREMVDKSQELQEHCDRMMFKKFGKLVDLEAVQTMSSSHRLEVMKYERQVQETRNRQELRIWQEKVNATKEELTTVTRENTERLRSLNSLLLEKKMLEDKLNARPKMRFLDSMQTEKDKIRRLQLNIQKQEVQIQCMKQEIGTLSRKGGPFLPPSEPRLPSIHRKTPFQHSYGSPYAL